LVAAEAQSPSWLCLYLTCDIEMQDPPPTMADDEEAVKHTESQGWDGKEVHAGDSFTVIAQKSEPTFAAFRISR
jgi:hypothetical protein